MLWCSQRGEEAQNHSTFRVGRPASSALLFNRSVVSDSLQPRGLRPARRFCAWDFPGKNTGVGCHFLLQGVFLTQGLNSCLLHCRRILYRWTTWETAQKGINNPIRVFPPSSGETALNLVLRIFSLFMGPTWTLAHAYWCRPACLMSCLNTDSTAHSPFCRGTGWAVRGLKEDHKFTGCGSKPPGSPFFFFFNFLFFLPGSPFNNSSKTSDGVKNGSFS